MTVNKEELSSEDWAAINDCLAEAADEFEKWGRKDMSDMCYDAFSLIEEKQTGGVIFAKRLRGRAKGGCSTVLPINKVWHDETLKRYVVCNYDYKMFLWAFSKGLSDTIDNLCIGVDEDKLSNKEKAQFASRVK